jgi:hypothetical protein
VAALVNLSFELEGAPGLPEGWAFTTQAAWPWAPFVGSVLNAFSRSEELDNADWTKADVSITADATAGPSGEGFTGTTADELVATGGLTTHFVSQTPLGIAGTFRFSVYAKQAVEDFLLLHCVEGNGQAYFDLANGTIGTIANIAADDVDIEDVGEGWYRCAITITTTAAAEWKIYVCEQDGVSVFTPASSESIYLIGAQLREADGVTTYQRSGAQPHIFFGAETFESSWGQLPWITEVQSPVVAIFGDGVLVPVGVPRETFEAGDGGGWDLAYLFQLGATIQAEFDTTNEDFEDFEEEWVASQSHKLVFVGIGTDLEAAVFDAGGSANDYESFEAGDGWDAAYDTELTAPTAALFDGASAEPYEDFEEVKLRQAFTVTPSTDNINAPSHGFTLNNRLQTESTGRLPDGLSPEVDFYAVATFPNTLQVSWEASGSAIDITDPGTGTHRLIADETLFWTEEL